MRERVGFVVGQEGVCVSQGSRFPKFSLENHAPRKASKGKIDLTLCRYYRKKTCCDVVQTHAAVLTLQKLAGSGEASSQCLEQWEVLECSICDPRVGITPGPPLLCPAFCESVFSACADAFFSTDPLTQVSLSLLSAALHSSAHSSSTLLTLYKPLKSRGNTAGTAFEHWDFYCAISDWVTVFGCKQMLMPCGPKDVLCARAKEWASNSSAFCQLAGFASVDTRNQFNFLEERACYDGKAEAPGSADEVVKIKQRSTRRAKHDSSLDMLRKYIENMDVAVQIMWAIGGLVLTAGALHLR